MSDTSMEPKPQDDLDPATVQSVLQQVKDLIRFLEGTAASRVKIVASSFQIEVERASAEAGAGASAAPATLPTAHHPPSVTPAVAGQQSIIAPLVGVFFRASGPGARPFVEVGDTVEAGQTVGIVEAMKVMNEVVSDHRGVVTEILVKDGEAVRFEQALMLVQP